MRWREGFAFVRIEDARGIYHFCELRGSVITGL